MEILSLLNKQFNNKYDFLRVLKVDYNTLFKNAEIWFLYPEDVPEHGHLRFRIQKDLFRNRYQDHGKPAGNRRR